MAVVIKSLLVLWICLAGAWTATIPARSEEATALPDPFDTKGMTAVQYNDPH
jgi:hypothetical protein